mmetsp:Transcript_18269/g.38201  ORF Transcript_18269/g.38201 Transcript_18269/m.38201 type:complete len:87 (+) Transcript_18269:1189-1449(+)
MKLGTMAAGVEDGVENGKLFVVMVWSRRRRVLLVASRARMEFRQARDVIMMLIVLDICVLECDHSYLLYARGVEIRNGCCRCACDL